MVANTWRQQQIDSVPITFRSHIQALYLTVFLKGTPFPPKYLKHVQISEKSQLVGVKNLRK